MASREYNIVVLGAGGVGKSAITVQFTQGVFLDSYDPTIEDSYRRVLEIDGRSCQLDILDTAGVEQFTAMRELYIKNGQGFLLVYSVTDRASFDELLKLREQVCRIKGSDKVPIVLAGNKADLAHARTVSFQDAKKLAHHWGTTSFYETSARTGAHIYDIFADIVRQIQRRDSAGAAREAPTPPKSSSAHGSANSSSSISESSTSDGNARPKSPSEKSHKHSLSVLSSSDGRRSVRHLSRKNDEGPISPSTPIKTFISPPSKKTKKKSGMCLIL
ncbi:P-loop containing nucleoside triphosphate hydrolase protein [Lipomyces oligophaga]|uniref:P-loop containing nucleoside triphosphate hydrolase protein n=1 Tax=Lipomyces oligophaga TaxID=45792 RepID=UPI0034CFCB16